MGEIRIQDAMINHLESKLIHREILVIQENEVFLNNLSDLNLGLECMNVYYLQKIRKEVR